MFLSGNSGLLLFCFSSLVDCSVSIAAVVAGARWQACVRPVCGLHVHVHVNRQLALTMDSGTGDRVAAGTERSKPGVAGRGSRKRQPVPLSLKQKAWIVLEREKGVKPKAIAAALGRTLCTIYTVLAKKDAILAEWKVAP